MQGEHRGDVGGEAFFFVAAPKVAPQVAVVRFLPVVVEPVADEGAVFVAVAAREVVAVRLHQFYRGEPQGLLCLFAQCQPLAQLGDGLAGGQRLEAVAVVVGVMDEGGAAVAAGAPGEVLKPVAVLVFGLGFAGA